jgi:tRNA threonylcarbamoyl adenosine modification protein (Sua5/YciO/YrdC/YwlC family)
MGRWIETNPSSDDRAVDTNAFDQVVAALKAGKAAIFPTDTVYGLGVAIEHAPGPAEIFSLKRRDASKPVAWLVGSVDDLQRYGREVSPRAFELAEAHWPGGLTLIVKASDAVPKTFRAENGTIALRMPASATALALIHEIGPIAASSANQSGDFAPKAFSEINPALLEAVPSLSEDGQVESGIASTVIDCTQKEIVIVRQGDHHV